MDAGTHPVGQLPTPWTEKELARTVGVTNRTVQFWRAGENIPKNFHPLFWAFFGSSPPDEDGLAIAALYGLNQGPVPLPAPLRFDLDYASDPDDTIRYCTEWIYSGTLRTDDHDAREYYVKILNIRGNAYARTDRYNLAFEDFGKAIRISPTSYATFYLRGQVHKLIGLYDLAIQDLNHAIRLNPDFSDAYYLRGCVYYVKSEYAAAVEDLDRAIFLSPDAANAIIQRGIIHHVVGQRLKAVEDFSRGIELNADNASTYHAFNTRGIVFRELGLEDQAVADFEKATELAAILAREF